MKPHTERRKKIPGNETASSQGNRILVENDQKGVQNIKTALSRILICHKSLMFKQKKKKNLLEGAGEAGNF